MDDPFRLVGHPAHASLYRGVRGIVLALKTLIHAFNDRFRTFPHGYGSWTKADHSRRPKPPPYFSAAAEQPLLARCVLLEQHIERIDRELLILQYQHDRLARIFSELVSLQGDGYGSDTTLIRDWRRS